MKRFLLFAGSTYYPEGGWCDFQGGFDSREEAETHFHTLSGMDWHHIVDTHSESINKP